MKLEALVFLVPKEVLARKVCKSEATAKGGWKAKV